MNPSTSHPVFSWLLGRRRNNKPAAAAPATPPPASPPHEADVSAARKPASDRARRRLLAALYAADVQRALLDALPVPVIVTLLADHTLLHANALSRRWLDGCDAAQGDLWARMLDAPARDWFLARAASADGVDGLAVQWHGADGGRGASPLRLSARRIDFGGRSALLTTLLGAAEPSAPATGAQVPAHGDVERRCTLRAALPQAIARGGELRLRCQPRIDGRSGRAVSVEAFVEWLHPAHGLLTAECWDAAPGEAAAATDTAPASAAAAPALDPAFDWALAESCALWRRWRDDAADGAAPATIALRVPAAQPLDLRFAAAVEARLAGVGAGAIELELAEPALAGSADRALAALQRLKAAGLLLSVGSFGTGRASLETLHGLPIDALRIDASLVQALADGNAVDAAADDPATRIVRAIVELGRALDRKVGSHGVAHPAEEAALLHAGCDELQGPLYGDPMTPDACAAWLRGHGDLRTGAVLIDS